MREFLKNLVRPVAITVVAPIFGFILLLFVELVLKTEVSKLVGSIFNLIVVTPIAFLAFPKWIGIPFGRIEPRDFIQKVGFILPERAWRHILLGMILAICTLSGMLSASILTGRYQFDSSTINLPHLVFSINPAIWEELFYRGVMMFILLKTTRSLKVAAAVQIILFSLAHIKGTEIWDIADVLSVAIIGTGFTYTAHKTRSLIAPITFHYLHDAFLLTVQPPGREHIGVTENLTFYGILWFMVGLGCAITWFSTEYFGIRSANTFYESESLGIIPVNAVTEKSS